MSLFESLGERTERIKQKFTSDTRYECLSCEAVLKTETEPCPNCGSETVAPVD